MANVAHPLTSLGTLSVLCLCVYLSPAKTKNCVGNSFRRLNLHIIFITAEMIGILDDTWQLGSIPEFSTHEHVTYPHHHQFR